MPIDRSTAEVYADWFRCLADPTRILILNVLAHERRAMTVGEIVETVDVGQSTVSHHLRILEDVGFVLAERAGTSSLFSINQLCVANFPSAAQLVMGTLPPPDAGECGAPWLEGVTPGATRRRHRARRTDRP